jgi:hypothetical protein
MEQFVAESDRELERTMHLIAGPADERDVLVRLVEAFDVRRRNHESWALQETMRALTEQRQRTR